MGNKLISKINLVGEEATLRIENHKRFSTKFSITLSILIILTTSFISFLFIKNNLDTTSPGINIELKTTSTYPEIDLHKNKIYFVILLVNIHDPKISLLNYTTLNSYIAKKSFVKDSEDNVVNVKFESIPLKVAPCGQIPNSEIYYKYIKENNVTSNFFTNRAYCVYSENEENYKIVGQPIEESHGEMIINFLPCSLSEKSYCLDPNNSNFLVIYPTPDLELSKINDFLTYVPAGDLMLSVNPEDKNIVIMSFKQEIVKNERQLFGNFGLPDDVEFVSLDEKRSYTAYRDESVLYCTKENFRNLTLCPPLIELRVQSSGNLVITTRRYPELIFALSEIGGITEIILIFASILYFFYQKFGFFDEFLVEKILKRKKEKCDSGCNYEDYAELVEENFDVLKLFKEINGLKILNKIFFKDHHRVLMPELLIKLKKIEKGEIKIFEESK